jgi:hypothetical protein
MLKNFSQDLAGSKRTDSTSLRGLAKNSVMVTQTRILAIIRFVLDFDDEGNPPIREPTLLSEPLAGNLGGLRYSLIYIVP